MRHYVLFYDYPPDYLARRAPLREAHFAHARPYVARGELVLAGAFSEDEPNMGMLVFLSDGPETAEAFARADPYVTEGLATSWRVRPWTTVAGPLAVTPLV